jgi:hypothetical protein
MHKYGRFIPPVILGFSFLLSACDYTADKGLIETLKKQQQEQEAKINLLEKQQTSLISATTKLAHVVGRIERKQRLFEYTELDPSQTRYFVINNGNVGLAGRILSIEPIDDGSVIHISLVNLLSVPVSNVGFHATWGGEKPIDLKEYAKWQQLLFSTTMNSKLKLLPGQWQDINLTLKGVSPNNLKYLKLAINMQNINFDNLPPADTRQKKSKK